MNPQKFVYSGIAFKQNPKAPELFAFVAPADDLVTFCGVARKSEQILTNYQRALDDTRVDQEVKPFFKIPENCTPTAVVISLHETPIASLKFEDVIDPEGVGLDIKRLTLTLTDPASLTDDEVVTAAKEMLDSRLKSDESSLAEIDDSSNFSGVSEGEDDEEPQDESGSVSDEEEEDERGDDENGGKVEIGRSMLREMREKLNDPSQVAPLIDTLRDMLKPALIIDGQHRIFGAARLEENIPLLVCSLVKPDWKEQVFQFTVINDKAQGIPKPFITSLAGMSLTSGELSDLQTRLSQAGVQLWEVDVMQRLGYDPRSAFFSLIEFKTTGAGSAGLGYQTMKQLGRAWFDPKAQGLVELFRVLYAQGSKSSSRKALVSQWQKSEDWFKYFCFFWDHFKDKFAATPLWKTHSSFMTAVVLLQLQHSFLRALGNFVSLTINKIDEPDAKQRALLVESQFKDIVAQWGKNFSLKHFPASWGVKSLNHKDGKAKLLDYFDKISVGSSVTNHGILTGK